MLVSVIIPTFNRGMFLCELVESLFRQTYKQLEIIIVNDFGEKVDFIKELYPELNLKLIQPDRKLGHVVARNEGVHAASGNYILLCDDDDMLLPHHIEECVKVLDAGEADFVHTDAEMFEFTVEEFGRQPFHHRLFAYDYTIDDMKTYSTYVPSGTIYRKKIHEVIGSFDPEINNYWDWDFFLRVYKSFNIKKLPIASVLYAHGHGSNSQDTSKMRPYLDRLCAKHGLPLLPTNNFGTLLQEDTLKARQSKSRRSWDSGAVVSRYGKMIKKTI
nr:glycosyltransferase family 2 protein [Falsibacillus albus]